MMSAAPARRVRRATGPRIPGVAMFLIIAPAPGDAKDRLRIPAPVLTVIPQIRRTHIAITNVIRRRTARTATGQAKAVTGIAPAAHPLIVLPKIARPATAMVATGSVTATRTNCAVTAHAMTGEPRDAVEVLFITAQPKSVAVVLLSILIIYVTLMESAVVATVVILKNARAAWMIYYALFVIMIRP